MKNTEIIFAVEFERYITGASIFGMIISDFSYWE